MNVLDLFSAAAGGWSLGMHRAGFRTVAACEAVDWRRTLYAENNPGVLIYDDVRTLTAERLVRDIGFLPDVVVGSPPCQDISSANTKGKGVDGERIKNIGHPVGMGLGAHPDWNADTAQWAVRLVMKSLEAEGFQIVPLAAALGVK